MPDFGLESADLSAVTGIFRTVPRIHSAAIFGSRAKGNYKPYSDVDIVLYGDLDILDVEQVIADLEELPLVYQFDVVAYGLVKNPAFREHIERVGMRIYEQHIQE
jgi:predicted nucleotidyltransferase